MTLRLTVDDAAWRTHVREHAGAIDGLIPVVKGNGYGFGLPALAAEAAALARTIAVGTVHEARAAAAVSGISRLLILSPIVTGTDPLPENALPTIGSAAHVGGLAATGWTGAVAVKLASSMHRYGAGPRELVALCDDLRRAGHPVEMFVLHLPLISASYAADAAVAEVEQWLARVTADIPMSISHLPPTAFAALQAGHPQRRLLLRSGTALWHGDKSFLHLAADVVDTRRVSRGQPAGYRRQEITADGTLVMIGAGSSHGVAPLPDGSSPFHHARRRLALVEPPHMHTSMAFVADADPCPGIGDWVDVQRPLTATWVDEVVRR